MRVLVVEDNKKTALFISKALKAEGFAVDQCHDGNEAWLMIQSTSFDAVILDIMLPGLDGLSLVRQLRKCENKTPILLLSAHGEVGERVEGLNAGAEDYLAKPFALSELMARVRALGRRGGNTNSPLLRVCDLELDTIMRTARRGARKLELTAKEFRLLELFMASSGRVYSRMMILEKVWDYSFDPGSNIVDVYIHKLREKVDDGFDVKLLHSVRGEGYVLKEIA
jgi:DNA-binding response OmpR family regulator